MTITADYVFQGVNPQQIAAARFDVQVVETTDDSGVAFTAAQVKQMESGGSQHNHDAHQHFAHHS